MVGLSSAVGHMRRGQQALSLSRLFVASAWAIFLSCMSSFSSSSHSLMLTLAFAYDPDVIGVIQPNRYQISHGDRLIVWVVVLAIIAVAGLVFIVVVFSCDWLEKRRTRQVDHERCIKHIQSFEDRQSGPVKQGERVFDFHYFPTEVRPDYVITDEMASVDDDTIRFMRHQSLQRRQMEHASRHVIRSARSHLRMTTAALLAHPPNTPPQPSESRGPTDMGGAKKTVGGVSRPSTPMVGVGQGAGLTSSTNGGGGSYVPLLHQNTAPIGLGLGGGVGGATAAGAALAARVGFYDDLDDDPDYFGFDDDLEFDLGS